MKTKKLLYFLLAAAMLVVVLSSCAPSYTVTFKNYDGTVLEVVKLKEDALPTSTIAPTRASDDIYNYIFDGWDKEIVAAAADTEYTATYKECPATVKWFEGKKIVFLGDSVTYCYAVDEPETYGYPYVVTNTLKAELVNMGTNSRTFCQGGHRDSCLDDIPDMPTDADIVIVALGVNDWDQGVIGGYQGTTRLYDPNATYYELGEEGTTDTSTIRGAVAAYCERISEHLEKDDARIYFMTPMMCAGNYSVGLNVRSVFDPTLKNIHGFTQEDMNDVIFEICEKYGIKVIDTYSNCGIDETNAAEYYVDGIHPNAAGHQAMADEVIRVLKDDILTPAN